MTTKNAICIRCENLYAETSAFCISDNGNISLISNCLYGGKNAGNRAKCKRFKEARAEVIAEREKIFVEREARKYELNGGAEKGAQ